MQLRKWLRNLTKENCGRSARRRHLDVAIGDWADVGVIAQDTFGKGEIRAHQLLTGKSIEFEFRQPVRLGGGEVILGFANT